MTYVAKTEQEIKQLALDTMEGRVFGSWMVPPEDVTLSFTLLALLERKDIEEMQQNNIVHFYEYMDKAGPRSINGLPNFLSLKTINDVDAKLLAEQIKKLQAMREEFMKS